MLTFFDRDRTARRREFLRLGSLALGGLALPTSSAVNSVASTNGIVHDRSVILLFLHGGPSQTETFDPKMSAPSGICSATGEVQTSIPGVTFGGTFPRLAQLASQFSIVRSFQTGNGNHDIKPVVSEYSANSNLGSIYSRIAGTNRPNDGMPTNVALFPRSVNPDTQEANLNFGDFRSTGPLGAAFAPFVPGGRGTFQEDLKLHLSLRRLADRRTLLQQLDRRRRANDATGSIDRLQQQAFDTIAGGVAQAFDLKQENDTTIQRYDTAPLVRPQNISRKWNNYHNYVDNAKSLGRLMLLARRLCEAGCGFVTVTTNFVWDMHADVNNAGVDEGMHYMGLPLDHAVSAFIEDVQQRGLRDKILLIVCGEMGRTPKINANGGRDHWGGLAPLLLFGGGLKMGQVIGQSNRDASRPSSEPLGIDRLIATIMHTLFDVGQLRTVTGLPNDVLRTATTAEPIPGLK